MDIGDKVIVIGNTSNHNFTLGSRIRIKRKYTYKNSWYCKKWIFGITQVLTESELQLI